VIDGKKSLLNPSRLWLRRAKLWQGLLFVYWLALFAATHVPKRFPGLPTHHWDKAAHFAAYALLAALLATAWQLAAGRLARSHLIAAWVVLLIYAVVDEWTQLAVGRDASFLDGLADAAGAGTGLVLFAWLRRRLP
jgi:VanZ family protein